MNKRSNSPGLDTEIIFWVTVRRPPRKVTCNHREKHHAYFLMISKTRDREKRKLIPYLNSIYLPFARHSSSCV
jgi:hypothetical protein